MNITIDLDEVLLAKAEAFAVRNQMSLTRLIEEGLQLRLRAQRAAPAKSARLPVYRGNDGLVAGLDGLSNKAIFEAADGDT